MTPQALISTFKETSRSDGVNDSLARNAFLIDSIYTSEYYLDVRHLNPKFFHAPAKWRYVQLLLNGILRTKLSVDISESHSDHLLIDLKLPSKLHGYCVPMATKADFDLILPRRNSEEILTAALFLTQTRWDKL